jgi:Tfp pilus assembly pilus retraction ATPase PilT
LQKVVGVLHVVATVAVTVKYDVHMNYPEDIFRSFINAYQSQDRTQMRELLSESMQAHITTSTGGVDEVTRANAFLETLTLTQAVVVEPGRVLALVQVNAQRGQTTLHNFGGFLTRVVDGQITELWMVDALPEESAAFWA